MTDLQTPIRLTNDDWQDLLPGTEIKLGKSVISLYPLGVGLLTEVIRKLNLIKDEIIEAGIDFTNFSDIKKLLPLTSVILEKCPEIIQTATNIHVDDIKRLPLDTCVKLINDVIDINLKSKEGLEKNFIALTQKISSMVLVEEKANRTQMKHKPGK